MRYFLFLLLGSSALFLQPPPCRAADGKFLLTVVDAKTHKPIACRLHLDGPRAPVPRVGGPRKSKAIPSGPTTWSFRARSR